MATLDDFWHDVLSGLGDLVQTHLTEHKDEALEGATAFLQSSEVDVKKYTMLFTKGEINRDDYYWLLKSRLDLARLHAVTEVGIAQVRLEHFRIALIDHTVGVAFRFVGALT